MEFIIKKNQNQFLKLNLVICQDIPTAFREPNFHKIRISDYLSI